MFFRRHRRFNWQECLRYTCFNEWQLAETALLNISLLSERASSSVALRQAGVSAASTCRCLSYAAPIRYEGGAKLALFACIDHYWPILSAVAESA